MLAVEVANIQTGVWERRDGCRCESRPWRFVDVTDLRSSLELVKRDEKTSDIVIYAICSTKVKKLSFVFETKTLRLLWHMLCFGGAFVLLLVIIVNFSVLEESVHHVQCVIIVQLQQEPSFIIYVSIAM